LKRFLKSVRALGCRGNDIEIVWIADYSGRTKAGGDALGFLIVSDFGEATEC